MTTETEAATVAAASPIPFETAQVVGRLEASAKPLQSQLSKAKEREAASVRE